jgi:O-antigen/teichoic acid export membrane protein
MVASADALSDILAGALQRKERLDRVALGLAAKGILGLSAVAFVVVQGGGALAAALAVAVVRWLVLAIYELPTASRVLARDATDTLQPRWQFRRLRELAWTALPLGCVMLLMSLQANIPRYWLKSQTGAESLGVFVGLLALTQLGSLVVNALGQAASPRLANAFQGGRRRAFFGLMARLVLVGGLFGLLGVLLVAVAGPKILLRLYGPEYAAQAPAFLILMVSAAVLYMAGPLGYAATAARRIRLQPIVHAVNLVVTIVAVWWAGVTDVWGMAWVMLVSSLTVTGLYLGILALPEVLAVEKPRQPLAG